MKTTIQELGATADATTTGTAGFNSIITGVVGKVWLKNIIDAAKQLMFFEQFATVETCPDGNKDASIQLTRSHIDFNITTAECSTRHFTAINNLTAVVFTPTPKKFGTAISKQIVRTSRVNAIKHAREEMMYDAALTIDAGFDTILHAAGAYTGTGPVAGGSVAGTGTNAIMYADRANEAALVAGDTLSPSILVKARRVLKQQGWRKDPRGEIIALFNSVSEEALLNDSQFVNASEYGSNVVVMTGEIGNYLGIRCISSEQCGAVTVNSLAGHYVYVLKAKVSYGIMYGEKPTLDAEYKKNEAEFRVYLDMCYEQKLLQHSAIQLVCVLDE